MERAVFYKKIFGESLDKPAIWGSKVKNQKPKMGRHHLDLCLVVVHIVCISICYKLNH